MRGSELSSHTSHSASAAVGVVLRGGACQVMADDGFREPRHPEAPQGSARGVSSRRARRPPPPGGPPPWLSAVVIGLGAFSLGIVVAYLAWYFVVRLDSFTIPWLGALMAVLVGGAVLAFLARHLKSIGSVGFALYAIGLLVGSLLYGGVYTYSYRVPPAAPLYPTPRPSIQSQIPVTPTTSPAPTPTPAASAQIVSPQQLDHVSMSDIAQGNVQNVPPGKKVWLIVELGPYYWPEATLSPANGEWTQQIIFGNPTSQGQRFTLFVLEADSVADTQFSNKRVAMANGNDSGMTQGSDYPDSSHLVTLAKVDVVRQ